MTSRRAMFWSAAALWLVASLGARDASACRCIDTDSAATAYRRAHAVGVSRVVAVSAPPDGERGKVVLEVTRAWKNDLPTHVEYATGSDCTYPLVAGETYLLFFELDGTEIYTARCMGNRPLAKAKVFLDWLETHGRAAKAAPA